MFPSAYRLVHIHRNIGGTQRGKFALVLQIEAAQQPAGRSQAVGRTGPHVGERFEVLLKTYDACLDACRMPAVDAQRALGLARAASDAGHAAECKPGFNHPLSLDDDPECGANGGNILIESLRHFVAAEQLMRSRGWNCNSGDEFTGGQIFLLIADVEILERQSADLRPASQLELRVQRNQRRYRVPDRRAVREIAAKRRGITNGW